MASAAARADDAPIELAAQMHALRGAAPSAQDTAVVALVAAPLLCGEKPRVLCSGTLIAPRVVLTAAHCVELAPPASLVVQVGMNAGESARQYAVREARVHPDYQGRYHDLSLLLLEQPLADVEPLPLASQPVVFTSGMSFRVVGYGLDDLEQVGTRRAGTSQLAEVSALELTLVPGPSLSCTGDSGGPVLRAGERGMELVAVAIGGDVACRETSLNARIDSDYARFLAPTLEEWSALNEPARPPLEDGADLCETLCRHDADCPLGTTCVAAPGARRCARAGLYPGRPGALCASNDPFTVEPCLVSPHGSCARYEPCTRKASGCSALPFAHASSGLLDGGFVFVLGVLLARLFASTNLRHRIDRED